MAKTNIFYVGHATICSHQDKVLNLPKHMVHLYVTYRSSLISSLLTEPFRRHQTLGFGSSLDVQMPSSTYTAATPDHKASKASTTRCSMNQLALTLLLIFHTYP